MATRAMTAQTVGSRLCWQSKPLPHESAATSPTPLLGAGALGGNLSATRVQGTHGWTIARQDADGEWNGIAWQATPNRIIAVSGHAPLAVIQEIAESLTIVDEDEWKTALPNYTTS